MAKGKSEGKASGSGAGVSLLKCVGDVCFNADGSIDVKLSQDADPRCVKATVDAITTFKPVRFVVTPTLKGD